MLKRLLLAAFIVAASPTVAQTPQVPISGLPPATTPLNGTEQIPIVQAGVTRRVSANQMPIIPPTAASIGGVLAATAPANQVMYGIAPNTGLPLFEQLSFANLSGSIAGSQIPAPTGSTFGGMLAATAPTNQFQIGNIAGVPQFAQPSFANIAGSVAASQLASGAAVANLGFTPANQTTTVSAGAGLTGGGALSSNVTLALAQPSSSVLGGILAATAPSNQFQIGVSTTGAPIFAQPAFSNLSGQIALGQIPSTAATTVNGQTCAIGGTCTISASAGTITPGTTSISGGTTNGLLFNNGGTLGNLGTGNNGVAVTSPSGVPSISTTLPAALTIPTATLSSPTVSGTLGGTGVVPNAALANSTISGVALGGTLPVLTIGTHLSGTSYNGSAAVTIATDATNAGTPSTIVARDASGNFAAGTITAALTGHASSDLALAGGTMSGALAMGGNAISGAGAISGTSLTASGLSTQGAACNSAAGLLSTSATGCPGVTQSVAAGGTGTGTASGTAVDNISGFSGTGLMRRTGAGAYSFGTTAAIGEGGTGQTTAAAARGASGLNIDDLCTFGDANYTVPSTCRQVQTTTAFTAPRTLTLPAASSVNGGQRLAFKDAAGAITSTNTLTITRAGSDLINGSSSQALTTAYAGADLDPDGVSKWTYTASSSGGGGSGTVSSLTAGPGLSAQGGAAGGTISTSGTMQMADQQRRNLILDHINMAKALGTALLYIGEFDDGFADISGIYVSSSSNYTPNATAKTVSPTTSGGRDVDLHFDQANGTTGSLTDSGSGTNAPHTISTTGSYAAISTSQYKFGSGSLYTSQSSNSQNVNGATITAANDINFGTGDFTVETFVYITAAPSYYGSIFSNCAASASDCFTVGMTSSRTLQVYRGTASSSSYISGSTAIALNTWTHVAFTRASGNDYLYVGGTYQGTTADTTSYGSHNMLVGMSGGTFINDLQGYFDEFATLKNTAAYSGTSNITPPSAPFSSAPMNMTLVSVPQTAPATVSNARAAITLNSAASPTWGTSDTLEVSTNGGTNWTSVTPVNAGPVQAGSGAAGQGAGTLWEAPDTPTTAGTQYLARYKTLTNPTRTVFSLSTAVH